MPNWPDNELQPRGHCHLVPHREHGILGLAASDSASEPGSPASPLSEGGNGQDCPMLHTAGQPVGRISEGQDLEQEGGGSSGVQSAAAAVTLTLPATQRTGAAGAVDSECADAAEPASARAAARQCSPLGRLALSPRKTDAGLGACLPSSSGNASSSQRPIGEGCEGGGDSNFGSRPTSPADGAAAEYSRAEQGENEPDVDQLLAMAAEQVDGLQRCGACKLLTRSRPEVAQQTA